MLQESKGHSAAGSRCCLMKSLASELEKSRGLLENHFQVFIVTGMLAQTQVWAEDGFQRDQR